MKFIKIYESLNNLWTEINSFEWENMTVDKISSREQDIICSLIPQKPELNIPIKNEKEIIVRYQSQTRMGRAGELIEITIEKCDDYYYSVVVENDFGRAYYKCDEIEGLKQLLKFFI